MRGQDFGFLNASFTRRSLMPDPDCRAQEAIQQIQCSGNPGCTVTRHLLEFFQIGPNQLEFRLVPCQFFFQGQWEFCGIHAEDVERFVFCESEIPCGNEFDTCLMDADCCDGLSCNEGQCHGCPGGCPYGWVCVFGICSEGSPIVIDVLGDGIKLTNAANGVSFDITGDGVKEGLSWTTSSSDDAWLVLDRNGNGVVDNGNELFGNFTPQPAPDPGQERNGFLALSTFDTTENGGDGDGRIRGGDAVFSALRLWQDRNHNGISEANELHSMTDFGLTSIDLQYKTSRRRDEHGNQFRYRAKVTNLHGSEVGRWAWDVFLVTQ